MRIAWFSVFFSSWTCCMSFFWWRLKDAGEGFINRVFGNTGNAEETERISVSFRFVIRCSLIERKSNGKLQKTKSESRLPRRNSANQKKKGVRISGTLHKYIFFLPKPAINCYRFRHNGICICQHRNLHPINRITNRPANEVST